MELVICVCVRARSCLGAEWRWYAHFRVVRTDRVSRAQVVYIRSTYIQGGVNSLSDLREGKEGVVSDEPMLG